jgi:hypothetical protein
MILMTLKSVVEYDESRKLSYNNHNISSNFVFFEITFEQFKQYVFETVIKEETIEPLPQFK